jgi:hypothetical protein
MRSSPPALTLLAAVLTGCAAQPAGSAAPPLAEFCLEAQRVVVQTAVRPALVVHEDFDAFVLSKASIDPLTIHQYVWRDEAGAALMVSCKMKSADHLNEAFGAGTSRGHRPCQDMNRLTWQRIRDGVPAGPGRVVFDRNELVSNPANPGMTGPDWLAPYEMTWRDADGRLHVRSKGFRVDWLDPALASAPARFRGVQYCHFIAPEYLAALVAGTATPGRMVGKVVTEAPRPPGP